MGNTKWTEQLTIDMLPEQCREIAEIIGLEATIALCEKLGGMPVYLPKLDRMKYSLLRDTIKKEYNGYNAKQLAMKYNITLRSVENYIQGLPPPQIDGQTDLFGMLP